VLARSLRVQAFMADPALRRVLMTTDTLGGVWTYTLRLAAALAEVGVETTVAAMGGPPSPAQRADARRVPGLTLHESSYRLEWMDDPWDDVARSGQWLLDLERRTHPDIVHLASYSHGALPFVAPRVVVGHSCVLSWWRAVRGEDAPERYDRYRREVGYGLAAAHAVVAPSRAMLQSLESDYGVRGGVVIPSSGPRSLKPRSKTSFVLSAGRVWDEAKNIQALDDVAPKIPWPIYVAGSAEGPDDRDRTTDRTTLGNVRLLGTLGGDAMASWLARASIYAHPARYEPFGLAVLEAALAGCALVLGDIPSLREIWKDDALYVDPDDRRALACLLTLLATDDELRARLAAGSRRRALQFGAARMRHAYLSTYRRALEGVAIPESVYLACTGISTQVAPPRLSWTTAQRRPSPAAFGPRSLSSVPVTLPRVGS
jgi:glycogen synthase